MVAIAGDPLLEIKRVYKNMLRQKVLNGVTLSVYSGEIVVVRGRSGVGKTTLARIAALLEKPDKGSVLFRGLETSREREDTRAQIRLKYIGYVDQYFTLIEEFTVWENVELPLLFLGLPRRERENRIRSILSRLGLSGKEHRYPAELSGGERQRVAIARALVKNPLLFVGDEPFSNLDEDTASQVLSIFKQFAEERKAGFLLTTTDLFRPFSGIDKDFVLDRGVLLETSKWLSWRVLRNSEEENL